MEKINEINNKAQEHINHSNKVIKEHVDNSNKVIKEKISIVKSKAEETISKVENTINHLVKKLNFKESYKREPDGETDYWFFNAPVSQEDMLEFLVLVIRNLWNPNN